MWRVKEAEETKDETHEALRGATGSGNVSIGRSGAGTTTLNGTTSVTTLNMINPTGTLDIGNNITSGNVSIANGASYTGAIYIGGGTNRVGNAEFATSGSGNVIIGATQAPLFLRGSSTTFSSAITLGALPSTNAHLGFWIQGSLIATSTSFTPNTIWSIPIGAGNWIVTGNATFQNGTAWAVLSISASNNNIDSFFQVVVNASSVGPAINITRLVTAASATTLYLVAQANGAASLSSTVIQAIRVG
jgi:hypothetical protein